MNSLSASWMLAWSFFSSSNSTFTSSVLLFHLDWYGMWFTMASSLPLFTKGSMKGRWNSHLRSYFLLHPSDSKLLTACAGHMKLWEILSNLTFWAKSLTKLSRRFSDCFNFWITSFNLVLYFQPGNSSDHYFCDFYIRAYYSTCLMQLFLTYTSL